MITDFRAFIQKEMLKPDNDLSMFVDSLNVFGLLLGNKYPTYLLYYFNKRTKYRSEDISVCQSQVITCKWIYLHLERTALWTPLQLTLPTNFFSAFLYVCFISLYNCTFAERHRGDLSVLGLHPEIIIIINFYLTRLIKIYAKAI